MKFRKLGNSGLKMSVIGMGCWSFGGGAYWGDRSQKETNEIVNAALDAGINYFDTAEMYNNGASENSLGIALKGRRKEAIIGTKVSPSNCQPQILREHLDASLKRLQTNYVDIYMLHWPIEPHSIEHFTKDTTVIAQPPSVIEAFATLQQLQKEGKIRFIGLSNHGVQQMQEIIDTKTAVVVNEMPYNLFCRAIETKIISYCTAHSIGIIGYMALLQGILGGDYTKVEDVPPPQAHSRHFKQSRGKEYSRHNEEGTEEEMFSVLDRMREIAKQEDVSVAQLAIAWVLANNGVASNLVGSRNLQQLQNNLETVNYKLPTKIRTELDQMTLPILNKLGL
jgi:myo-inositol catabolism protein IolS